MAKSQGRQTLQFDVGQAMLHSLAIEQFYADHRAEGSAITRRTRITSVMQAGAMIEKAGLASVLSFLDTPEFHAAPAAAQQQMIFKAMALRLGVDLGDVPAIIPAATQAVAVGVETAPPAQSKPVEPPAAASKKSETGIDGDSRKEDRPPMNPSAVAAAQSRFKNIGSA